MGALLRSTPLPMIQDYRELEMIPGNQELPDHDCFDFLVHRQIDDKPAFACTRCGAKLVPVERTI